MDDNAPLSATELLDHNRDIQGSPTIRLLATANLGLYATLMDRHLAGGVIPETELVETAAKVAKEKFGLTVEIVTFSDPGFASKF